MTGAYLRHLVVAASAVVAAGVLGACSSPHAQTSSPGASPSGAPTVSPAPTVGLIPAPRGLTDRLVLHQSHVVAGTPIQGALVVTYQGHAPINLTRLNPQGAGLTCRPKYGVVLTNHRIPPEIAFTSDCSRHPFIIKPGVNRLAITVDTTYGSCSEVASQATRLSPACLPGRQPMPSLPLGRYEAVLVGDGLPLPAPAPVPVTLGSAS